MNEEKSVWDPVQYGKFADLRGRPAEELLQRVPLTTPLRIYDLGCGNGTVTTLLRRRWPGARIVGIDSSVEMLIAAQALDPTISWEEADIENWEPATPPDLIFSNAALHWLPHHAALFPRLLGAVAPGGVLAVQMPHNHRARSHTAVRDAGVQWVGKIMQALERNRVHTPRRYYDLLASTGASSVDVWETDYMQVLHGPDPVVEWAKGTTLRPVKAVLTDDEWAPFLDRYRELVTKAYPPRSDGTTLMPFRRLFIVASR